MKSAFVLDGSSFTYEVLAEQLVSAFMFCDSRTLPNPYQVGLCVPVLDGALNYNYAVLVFELNCTPTCSDIGFRFRAAKLQLRS
ncbi:hypothetical protein PV779_32135 [Streptomyces sp. ID01-9D]|nr:hypothetical protein [Streptomyces sp. ID01-9D]